ncbi:hypothetical protein ACFQ60_23300 [Streptomyces zhihengii]
MAALVLGPKSPSTSEKFRWCSATRMLCHNMTMSVFDDSPQPWHSEFPSSSKWSPKSSVRTPSPSTNVVPKESEFPG